MNTARRIWVLKTKHSNSAMGALCVIHDFFPEIGSELRLLLYFSAILMCYDVSGQLKLMVETGTQPGPVQTVFWTDMFPKTFFLDRQRFL